MNFINKIVQSPDTEIYYIDITTNDINTDTGVTGSNNNFNVESRLILDENKTYYMEIVEFSYQNIASPADIKPLLLSDLGESISVNNVSSSIIYKSSARTGNTNFIDLNETNNTRIIRRVNRKIINGIRFEIVRSDNGLPFPFPGPTVVTILIKISNTL